MNIKNWFESGCDYETGLILYAKIPSHNRNLLRLFLKKSGGNYHEKLKYELGKHRELSNQDDGYQDKLQTDTDLSSSNTQKDPSMPDHEVESEPSARYHRMLLINELPVELHPLYIQQKNDFATACSLKIHLNALAPEEETKAQYLCVKIESLFDSIEKAWKVFDHYRDHRVVIDLSPKGYDSYTPAQLLKAEVSKQSSISKLKRRIAGYRKNLEELKNEHQKAKCERALAKSSKALVQHELDLDKIRQLVNS
jgi:hypothetical protein